MFRFDIIQPPESFDLEESRIGEIGTYVQNALDIPQKGILNIAFLPDDEIQKL